MKTFLLKVILFCCIMSAGLAALYAIFDHNNETIGDIRYVKTRKLFTNPGKYDALIIGSSRVFDLGYDSSCNYRIFNYGIIQGLPRDYPALIRFAKQNQSLKKIIVALDFYGTSKNGISDFTSAWESSESYIEQVTTESALNRWTSFYNFSRFKRLINYKVLANNPFARGQEKELAINPADTVWRTPTIGIYENAYSHYGFDEGLSQLYSEIKKACGDTELIVYITPESKPLFDLMVKKGLLGDYKRFITTAASSFGKVYNYMEPGKFTGTPSHFKDENHLKVQYLRKLVCSRLNNESEQEATFTVITAETGEK